MTVVQMNVIVSFICDLMYMYLLESRVYICNILKVHQSDPCKIEANACHCWKILFLPAIEYMLIYRRLA